MAKISEYSAATLPLQGTEVFILNQNNVTHNTTLSGIMNSVPFLDKFNLKEDYLDVPVLDGQVLVSDVSGNRTWESVLKALPSTTASGLVIFKDTSGKNIKDSGKTIDYLLNRSNHIGNLASINITPFVYSIENSDLTNNIYTIQHNLQRLPVAPTLYDTNGNIENAMISATFTEISVDFGGSIIDTHILTFI